VKRAPPIWYRSGFCFLMLSLLLIGEDCCVIFSILLLVGIVSSSSSSTSFDSRKECLRWLLSIKRSMKCSDGDDEMCRVPYRVTPRDASRISNT